MNTDIIQQIYTRHCSQPEHQHLTKERCALLNVKVSLSLPTNVFGLYDYFFQEPPPPPFFFYYHLKSYYTFVYVLYLSTFSAFFVAYACSVKVCKAFLISWGAS